MLLIVVMEGAAATNGDDCCCCECSCDWVWLCWADCVRETGEGVLGAWGG